MPGWPAASPGSHLNDIVQSLSGIVDAARILDSAAVSERATSFWSSEPMQAGALVTPITCDEVADVLRHCDKRKQAVLTHGGLTNCVTGVESSLEDVVISTEKMRGIIDIDRVGGTATVEAGAILQTVQETIAAEGLYFPLDLGARGSCTIGGNVSTNAGGINVLRYGMMRNLVLGLETVLADGTVVTSLNRMVKNNAGYDTKQMFIGSEGTLGIVTRVVLRLFPQPTSRQSALVAMNSFSAVTAFLGHLQQQLAGSLCAFEVMWNDYYHAVTAEGWHRAPLARDHAFYVVFQAEGTDADLDCFEDILSTALEDGLIVDAMLPKSEAETRDIWNIREDFEALTEEPHYYLYDVSLPIKDMSDYIDEVYRRIVARWPLGHAYTLGHVADGNLHLFVVPGDPGANHHEASECVYGPLREYDGSVSAEHGIGLDKTGWLPHSRSATDIDLMRTLKRTLDPNNILNPGRVLQLN